MKNNDDDLWEIELGEKPKSLVPHNAEPKIEILAGSAPMIYLSLEAYRDINYIIEAAGEDEIGWLGSVKILKDNVYCIDRIFLFEQEVSGAHCEFESKDLGKCKFFIRGIFTRGGQCMFTFYDYSMKIRVIDCPWGLYCGDDDDKRRKEIIEEVREKVKKRSYGSKEYKTKKKDDTKSIYGIHTGGEGFSWQD
ncbi:MAG: hypothetical protein HYW78_02485 [Parcubacteria group bacterium]|nr:hypothetical protein [Parcubacteria group bacterium]